MNKKLLLIIINILIAAELNSQNIDLLVQWPSYFISCLESDEKHVFIGASDTVIILDASVEKKLTYISRFNVPNLILGLKKYKENYLLVSTGSSGMYIYDISTLTNPSYISHYITPDYLFNIETDSNYVYLSCGNKGMRIIDMTDIQNPLEIGHYDTPGVTKSIKIKGNFAYLADNLSGIRIIDISNKSNPIEVSNLNTVEAAMDISVNYKNAFVARGTKTILMVNIENPLNPIIEDSLGDNTVYYNKSNIIVDSSYCYYAVSYFLSIFDIRTTPPQQAGKLFTSSSFYITKNSKYIFVACAREGLSVTKFNQPTSVKDDNRINLKYSLSQNYPNPFNPTTKINYEIPTSPSIPLLQGEGRRERSVSLKIYDILCREIETLVNEQKPAGRYSVEWNASKYSSGIYYYELTVGNGSQPFRATKKMMLLK